MNEMYFQRLMYTITRNADVAREREILLDKLSKARKSIELGITNMENSKKERDKRKKEIVLKEMKRILAKLDEEDKQVVGELILVVRDIRSCETPIVVRDTESNCCERHLKINQQL